MADDVKPMTIEEIDQADRVLSMMDARLNDLRRLLSVRESESNAAKPFNQE